MVSQAIAGGDVNALNYFVANNYVDALKEMAKSPNQKTLLLPMETTGILGSLAGIAELAKDSLASQRGQTEAAKTRTPPLPR
jgi:regulator of protease activity HflC (stomatin/prohibitin superfamily)